MIIKLLLSLLFAITLNASILIDSFKSSLKHNSDMNIAYAGVKLQKSSKEYAETLDN